METSLFIQLLIIMCLILSLLNLNLNIYAEELASSNQSKNNVDNSTNAVSTDYEHEQVPQPVNGPVVNDPNLEIQLVSRGLQSPSNMAFLGPDDILVLEKNNGTVMRIVNGTMLPDPVLDVEVANLVERGMLGIAITNDQKHVFLYYTESESDGSDAEMGAAPLGNRLYRYDFVDGKLTNPKLLMDIDASRGASHNGGKVLVGPDNNIYLLVGDIAAHKTLTQNYQNATEPSETSVILKVTQDGQSTSNILNNDEPTRKFYAYGIRNGFGMDFDPVTGYLWDTENGPDHGDEINLVRPGFNSGWAVVSGLSNLSGNINLDEKLVNCLFCIHPTGFIDIIIKQNLLGIQLGEYSEPEFTWNNTVGPTALKFLNSDKLGKQYENDIFVGDVNRGNIYHFKLNANRDGLALNGSLSDKVANSVIESDPIVFVKGLRGITDIDVGPDGFLYFLSYYGDGTIYRVVPKGTPLPY